MVGVQLPKSAIKYIEMFVREVLANHINVIFIRYLDEGVHKITELEIPPRNFLIVILINNEKYPHNNSISIPFLKLRSGLKELQSWMSLEQVLKEWLEIIGTNIGFVLTDQLKDPFGHGFILVVPPKTVDDVALRQLVSFHLLLLLYELKKHPLEYLGHFEEIHANRLELVQTYFGVRFPIEHFIDLFVILAFYLHAQRFALRVVELRHHLFLPLGFLSGLLLLGVLLLIYTGHFLPTHVILHDLLHNFLLFFLFHFHYVLLTLVSPAHRRPRRGWGLLERPLEVGEVKVAIFDYV